MKHLTLSLLLLVCLLFGQNVLGQAQQVISPPEKVTSVEGITEYKLSNGLQVLLVPDNSQTNVVVNIVYHVGSRMEGYGETGMAHLLEHMLFKGSKKFSNIKQTIADKGAMANGSTYYDRTNYFEILPASDENIKWSLEMEADRMVNSLMKKEDLQTEFSVVRNEFEAGENSPNRILMERILSTMYLWHNYGKSTIGSKEDIEKVPIENLRQFYQKYYQPDNATLVIGGKFDEKKTLQLISDTFGKITKPKRTIQSDYTVEPPQDGERFVQLKRAGDVQYIAAAYHTPCYSDKDYVANEAFINILTNNPSGILYNALTETKLATDVSGFCFSFYDPGFSYFSCTVAKDKDIEVAKSNFLSTFDNLINTPITQEQVDRAKNSLLKRFRNIQTNTINECISLTEIIGAGDWRLAFLYRDRLEKLTLADVQAVAKKYYCPTNRTYGIFLPEKDPLRVSVENRPDIASLVKDYKGRAVEVQTESFEPTIENIKKQTVYGKLSNGFRYALLKKPVKGDNVLASITFKIGDEKSLANKKLISSLTAQMLMNGTTSLSKKDIRDKLDRLKSSVYFSGGATSVYFGLRSDKKNLDSTLIILKDILLHPLFDQNEFDKMILEFKNRYEAFKNEPYNVAHTALSKKMNLYPYGYPYYEYSADEMLEELGKIKLDDLKKFYSSFYGSNNGFGDFVGSFEPEKIKRFFEEVFTPLNNKLPYVQVEEKYFDVKGCTESIKCPDKKNAVCAGGINLPIKDNDPDYPALLMANEMLGGGAFLSSRIPQRLREKEGMSYGAGSSLDINAKYPTSTWQVNAIFNPAYKNRLDSALHDEINKALKVGFTEEELKKSVKSWLQQRQTYLGMDQAIGSLLYSTLDENKDLDEWTILEEKVKALKVSQVNEAMKKYLTPDKLILIYAGDFK